MKMTMKITMIVIIMKIIKITILTTRISITITEDNTMREIEKEYIYI